MSFKKSILVLSFALCAVCLLSKTTDAQKPVAEYTGNLIAYNGPRVQTASFTLRMKNWTSDDQANQNLVILQEGGQDKLLSAIQKEDVGSFSINNGLARTVNVARETDADGKKRIFVVFERWMTFAEVRGGYRSEDYPFSVIELSIDDKTGKGEGTFIAAAQIRWKLDKKTNQHRIEIDDFATFPAKMVNVKAQS